MRPESLSKRKIPVTPTGIEGATFRFVEQCLNQLEHRVSNGTRYTVLLNRCFQRQRLTLMQCRIRWSEIL
jgi:hypothetical protein